MSCPTPASELLFNSIVLGLFVEGKVPAGSVVDAGANSGEWACMYAEAQPSRPVHAIDPLEVNIKSISRKFKPLFPNIRARVGGLGDETVTIVPPSRAANARVGNAASLESHRMGTVWRCASTAFTMLRLDDLFANETLGFAHLDVEGGELAALRGGARVIQRDRRAVPVLTVELHVHQDPAYTHELLSFLKSLQYTVLLVEEVCGFRYDCRNLLALPKGSGAHFHTSHVLRGVAASERLFAVNAASIMTHAFPIPCTRGGPCCHTGPFHCCKQRCVHAWMKYEMKRWDASNSSSRDPRLFTRLDWLSAKASLAILKSPRRSMMKRRPLKSS
ncbi:hypothetical protein AB1Y20_010247 [Prymnesium parvum]|uniref:Methyltransferase FkbM domain-containing protein n=1 Tax=Prymnesium parvum TaxID=97485 RepID=A0AB34K8B8_PRYPA